MTLIRTCDLGRVGELDKIKHFQFIKFLNYFKNCFGILKIGAPVKFEVHSSVQHVSSTQGPFVSSPQKSNTSTHIYQFDANTLLRHVTSTRHFFKKALYKRALQFFFWDREYCIKWQKVFKMLLFGFFRLLVWKWRVKLMKSWGTDGFVWNWQIIGAEKERSLCGSDVLKWRLCGSEGYSKNCFIRPLMLIRAPLGQKGLCLLEKLKPGLKMAQRHQLRPPIPNVCSEVSLN